MNPYEMVVLYHPDLEIDIDKALKKVEAIVSDNKGKIASTDNWGKRKLAYQIEKQDHAIYVYYDVELPPEAIAKIESTFNITDEVIRYLIVKPGPEIEEDEKDSKDSAAKKDDDADEKKESTSDKEAKESKPKKTESKETSDETSEE